MANEQAAGAEVSACGLYRYRLWRAWAPGPRMLWVMLNPSTADGTVDDPTIRKCVGFAKRNEFPGIEVVNLFAWRATDPRELRVAEEPVGPDNDAAILTCVDAAAVVVFAWGGFQWPKVAPRARVVADMIRLRSSKVPHCFRYTGNGAPRHPLMLGYAAKLEEYGP